MNTVQYNFSFTTFCWSGNKRSHHIPDCNDMQRFALWFAQYLCLLTVVGALRVLRQPSMVQTRIRVNPLRNHVEAESFHHIEFNCGDACTFSRYLANSIGAELAAKSDLATGNSDHASYLMRSGQVQILCTAPYGRQTAIRQDTAKLPLPKYNAKLAADRFATHGNAAVAIGITVGNVNAAYNTMVANGGIPKLPPTTVKDMIAARGSCEMAEVKLYGDVVLRLIDTKNFKGTFLPNFEDVVAPGTKLGKYGIENIDHIVGNVHHLQSTLDYVKNMTGFHEFAEFTTEDVGTVDSGLNSCVLASRNEKILLPINEPTFGTKRKSQIQTYLEQNQGEGVQHIALFTLDIFRTLTLMRAATSHGGFEFMPGQGPDYYVRARERIGSGLTAEQYDLAEQMGILIDKDDQGILLQIFTKPIGDRPTIFFEIIQRIGCKDAKTGVQKPGCGGFGKGNFKDLFKSIENFENSLNINTNK